MYNGNFKGKIRYNSTFLSSVFSQLGEPLLF